jgi:hypothetical protein
MLAIAGALEGRSRAEAARLLAGMERQALRDAVLRYSRPDDLPPALPQRRIRVVPVAVRLSSGIAGSPRPKDPTARQAATITATIEDLLGRLAVDEPHAVQNGRHGPGARNRQGHEGGEQQAGPGGREDGRGGTMEHDPIELLARMAHVHATGEAGERIPWARLRPGRPDAKTREAAAMLGGLGRTSYPTNPEGLTAPGDIAAAAEARIEAWERGEAAAGETVARGMPLVMALVRSAPEGTP